MTVETEIRDYLRNSDNKELLRLLTAGSVDDGKSTLIGRLLHDSKGVFEDQLDALARDSKRRGSVGLEEIDFSLLLDGLEAEREQGITIDVAYRYFATPRRKFIIADSPGHEQYTRNMATGASTCDLAVILVDARNGVRPQTRRHSFIASLLGIRHLVVAINKMDAVGYDQAVFDRIVNDYTDFVTRLEVNDLHFIPISALKGDNVVMHGPNMPWFHGAPLLEYLETVHIASDRNLIDLRFPIQLVTRPNLDFRGYAGTVASGVLRQGDEVMVLPSGLRSRVKRLVTFDGDVEEAFPPMAVTVTLADELDISRGDMLVHVNNVPAIGRDLEAMVVWMHQDPLKLQRNYLVRHGTRQVPGEVHSLRYKVNVNTLHREPATHLDLNEIGRIRLDLHQPICYDPYSQNRETGAIVLIDPQTNATVGAGMILTRKAGTLAPDRDAADAPRSQHVQSHRGRIGAEDRAGRLGHHAATLWLTGLPRSGKTTIAYALEEALFERGCLVQVLDGENMRLGVSRDLGFSADDREEHGRRAAAVASLLNDAGLIAIAAFVSPYAESRRRAREHIGSQRFLEIHVDAPLALCEERDTSGLYAGGRSGEIPLVTGITAPYEAPVEPDLRLPTDELDVDSCVTRVIELLETRGIIPPA